MRAGGERVWLDKMVVLLQSLTCLWVHREIPWSIMISWPSHSILHAKPNTLNLSVPTISSVPQGEKSVRTGAERLAALTLQSSSKEQVESHSQSYCFEQASDRQTTQKLPSRIRIHQVHEIQRSNFRELHLSDSYVYRQYHQDWKARQMHVVIGDRLVVGAVDACTWGHWCLRSCFSWSSSDVD